MSRITDRFDMLAQEQRAALVTFMTAGFPDLETSQQVLETLSESGADVIELGMPFSDPVADGPTIQKAGQHAIDGGQTMTKTLEMVRRFRKRDQRTPIILMGYCNPVYHFGIDAFLDQAKAVGVDGLLIVDLPAEHSDMLCQPAAERGLNFIALTTPTTDKARLPTVLESASGFIYYVSVAGVTGGQAPDLVQVKAKVEALKAVSSMPVAVGFGVRTPEQAREIAQFSDGVVVGSALVELLAQAKTPAEGVEKMRELTKALAGALSKE